MNVNGLFLLAWLRLPADFSSGFIYRVISAAVQSSQIPICRWPLFVFREYRGHADAKQRSWT